MPRPLAREQGHLEVIIQPTSSLRFRYKSEAGKSAITGAGNAPCPVLKVHTFRGDAKLFASVVTVPEDAERPKPHPHQLAGPSTGHGFYSKDLLITDDDDTIRLENLSLVAIPSKDAKDSLELREQKKIDPYSTGFEHKDRLNNIDRNYVQLCFQLAVRIPGLPFQQLQPVCSTPILNTNKKGELEIVRYHPHMGPTTGGRMIILMNGVNKKEDVISVVFTDRNTGWSDEARFKQKYIHEMAAIMLFFPEYNPKTFPEPARIVDMVLKTRRGDTPPVHFSYISENQTSLRKKARKLAFRQGKAQQESETDRLRPQIPSVISNSSSWNSSSLTSDPSNLSQPAEDQSSSMSSNEQGAALKHPSFEVPAVLASQNSLPNTEDPSRKQVPATTQARVSAESPSSQKSKPAPGTTNTGNLSIPLPEEDKFHRVSFIPSTSSSKIPWSIASTPSSTNSSGASAYPPADPKPRPVAKPRRSLPAQQPGEGNSQAITAFPDSHPLPTAMPSATATLSSAAQNPTCYDEDIDLEKVALSLFSNMPPPQNSTTNSQSVNWQQSAVPQEKTAGAEITGLEVAGRRGESTFPPQVLQNLESFMSGSHSTPDYPVPQLPHAALQHSGQYSDYPGQTLPGVTALSQVCHANSQAMTFTPPAMSFARPSPAPRLAQTSATANLSSRRRSAPQPNVQSPIIDHFQASLSQDGQASRYANQGCFTDLSSTSSGSTGGSQNQRFSFGSQHRNSDLDLDDVMEVISEDSSNFMDTSPQT